MYASDITLNDGTNDHVYSQTLLFNGKSVRADAEQSVSEPNLLTISHEVANNGRVSSVIMRDNTRTVTASSVSGCAVSSISDVVRTQFKIAYNPTVDRDTINAELTAQLKEIIGFLGVEANFTKFLNREV
jgi:hypothetical protein